MNRAQTVLASLVYLAACSPAGPAGDVPAPSPTVPRAVASPGFVNGGRCPVTADPSLPPGSGCVSSAGALTVYANLDATGTPRSWHIRYGDRDSRLDAGNAYSYPRVVAEIDVDRDGRSEWLVKTYDLAGHGTNWQQLGLFVVTGGRAVPIASDGEPLAVRVGGISRMGEGATCRGGRLVLLRAVAENRTNTRWSYSMTPYRLDGSEAHRSRRHRGVLRLRGYNDPDLDPFYRIDCHGVSYP